MSRHFSVGEFIAFLGECEVRSIPTPAIAARAAADVLYEHAQKIYGDVTKLAPLAQSTQEERERLGYSPNDPLYRTGERLKDGLEKYSNADGLAGIGSSDIAAKANELGFYNVRAKRIVPARSTMRQGMSESVYEVQEIAAGVLSFVFGESSPRGQSLAHQKAAAFDKVVREAVGDTDRYAIR